MASKHGRPQGRARGGTCPENFALPWKEDAQAKKREKQLQKFDEDL